MTAPQIHEQLDPADQIQVRTMTTELPVPDLECRPQSTAWDFVLGEDGGRRVAAFATWLHGRSIDDIERGCRELAGSIVAALHRRDRREAGRLRRMRSMLVALRELKVQVDVAVRGDLEDRVAERTAFAVVGEDAGE